MRKPLEIVWVGLKVGWGSASENHPGGANNVNQVGEDSDMTSVMPPLGGRGIVGGPRKRTCPLQALLSGRKLTLQLSS